MSSRTDRREAHSAGAEAEWLASIYLRAKGYRILARRFRAAGGEIDLVAERFGALVFVEVKARAEMDTARVAITADKLRRIGRAGRAFIGQRGTMPRSIRLDALYLARGRWPRHEQAIAELDLN